jgi:hypothetical protein
MNYNEHLNGIEFYYKGEVVTYLTRCADRTNTSAVYKGSELKRVKTSDLVPINFSI